MCYLWQDLSSRSASFTKEKTDLDRKNFLSNEKWSQELKRKEGRKKDKSIQSIMSNASSDSDCAGDCFIIAWEPSVREMLQIPTVRKSGSFKSVLLAESAEYPSGVCYKALCRTWQQVWDNETSIPKTGRLHAKFCPSVTSLLGPVSELNLEMGNIGGTCYTWQKKTRKSYCSWWLRYTWTVSTAHLDFLVFSYSISF